jgi:hypothetical protein
MFPSFRTDIDLVILKLSIRRCVEILTVRGDYEKKAAFDIFA